MANVDTDERLAERAHHIWPALELNAGRSRLRGMISRWYVLATAVAVVLPLSACAGGVVSSAGTAVPHTAEMAGQKARVVLGQLHLPKGGHWEGAPVVRSTSGTQEQQAVRTMALPARAAATAIADIARRLPSGWRLISQDGQELLATAVPATEANGSDVIEVSLGPRGGHPSAQASVVIGWSPLRPADTVLPRTISTMDVTWSALTGSTGTTGPGGQQSLSGVDVATIVDWLDALPTLGPSEGAVACAYPLFYGADPVFTFHPTTGTVVFAYQDCYQVSVTIDGSGQPSLQASPQFLEASERFMRQALHVQAPDWPG